MLSLTKICILIAILLVAMEGKGANVKTPNEYQGIQMMEEEKEATGDSIDKMEENVEDEAEKKNNLEDEAVNPEEESDNNLHNNDVEDEVVDIGKNCDCDDKVNKALVNSLATCSQTLSTIENCKVGKVSSISTSKEHVVPCTCNKALTAHLVKSLKSCTQAVETLTKCKKGGDGGGGETVYDVNSCDELKKKHSTLKSGNYKLRIGGKEVPVSCYMAKLCGIKGGWTRLGHLEVSSDHKTCPNEQFSYINKGKLHLCRMKSDKEGCATADYSSHGIKYSTICGYAKGYHKGQAYAFIKSLPLTSHYLSGVSFQRFDASSSTKVRKHVWSYACGITEVGTSSASCPCNKDAIKFIPGYVGNNYYCESGTSTNPGKNDFFPQDPLWDGKGFNNIEVPCRKDMMPYFKRTYDSAITDHITVSLCRPSGTKIRDIYLEGYGVFVK